MVELGGLDLGGGQLVGLWRRSLLIDTDGSRDDTTEVHWLQSDGRFVDLRQPAGRPDFGTTASPAEPTDQQQAWLAGQQGFAGNLLPDADQVEWVRQIDLQPPPPAPDAGRLEFVDGVLYEYGVHADYVEHWQPVPGRVEHWQPVPAGAGPGPVWSVSLSGTGLDPGSGATALLVVVSKWFGWARTAVPGCTLAEISLGEIMDDQWLVTRSSRPLRESSLFTADFGTGGLQVSDLDDGGNPTVTHWSVTSTSPHFSLPQGASL